MKLRVMLVTDDGIQTGYAFEVKDIPSKYVGQTLVDYLNIKLNGYGD